MAEIVLQHGVDHIFPKTIPEKRARRDITAQRLVCCASVCAGLILADGPKITFFACSLSWIYLLLFVVQICARTCELLEEFYHLNSRYERKIIKLLRDTYSFNNNVVLITVVTVVALGIVFVLENLIENIQNNGIISWILVLIGMHFFSSFINLSESPLRVAKLIDELKSLDYGSGIAFSFFHGYLNLMLPCTGDERKGLKEQIEDYESKNQVKFASKKLYILIPLSAYCPTSIEQYSNCMTTAGSLDWKRVDRAGVKNRQYHNSVYKIWPNEKQKPIYVCAEYATPLLTLYEVMGQNTEESRRYKKYQKEIVTNFYLALDKIIRNSRDCKGLAELIYYRDIDNDGNPLDRDQLDIGMLLLERINQEKNK